MLSPKGVPQFNILLVEDNPKDAELVRLFLKESTQRNYRLTWETRLFPALDLLNSIAFDVVLLDLTLPDSQGIESLQRFFERAPHLAVVAITGVENEQLSIDAVRMGAQDYLLKDQLTPLQLDRVIGFAHERKNRQTQLTHLAHHDPLTGLPNRLFLFDRLQTSIERARRQQVQVAVLFADLDHFKEVNDSLGHSVGDLVLKETARRFQKAVRKADTVARLGGDEFVLVIEDPPAVQDVIKVARKLVGAIRHPYLIDGRSLPLTISVGISVFPADGDHCDQLVEKADLAMLRAKSKGKNTFQFFEPEMEITAEKLGNLEDALREALHDQQLRLYYQPRFSLADNRITGVEALLRWRHPSRGLLTPEAFFPAIEDSSLIIELGAWIMQQALHDRSAWQSTQLRDIPVSINIAPRQLRYPGFAGIVKEMLGQHKLPPQSLELEFNESEQLYASPPIQQLRQLGVGLAIDNFGVAATSLSGLIQLPCARLTLDRSLLQGLGEASGPSLLLSAAIAIGRSLNLPVVAKGIETTQQLQGLRALGCSQGQGFLFCQPLAADRLESATTMPRLAPQHLTAVSITP